MKYILAIMWALGLVLFIFGNSSNRSTEYGFLLLCITFFCQLIYGFLDLCDSIGQSIATRMLIKYQQRERELALLEQIANK